MLASQMPALLLQLTALAAGAGVSVQVHLNGRLGEHLGSTEITAALNSSLCFVLVVALSAATGAGRRARTRLADGARIRPWHLLAGLNGGFFLVATAAIAPKVGVALVTVALVCGQTLGGLGADHLGLGPTGRRAATRGRVAGAVLAIAAVGLGTFGAHGELHLDGLAIIVLVGVLVSLQQAAMGHVTKATGEPLVAAVANFAVGLLGTLTVALLATGGTAPGGWSAPAELWAGGLFGAFAAFATGKVVQEIGVLRFVLGFIAGQSLGGLALDIVAPTADHAVTFTVVLSVLLTLAAVVVGVRYGQVAETRPSATVPPRVA